MSGVGIATLSAAMSEVAKSVLEVVAKGSYEEAGQ
jgi:hypothetical protein